MDKYYRKVPPEQREQFMRFRREHPPVHFEHNGITWEYLTSGNPAGEPLLLFTGALSTADSAWRTLTLLDQDKYRLICPSYPPEFDTMSGLADGIALLLAHLEIQSTYVVGGSYGGMLAQVFTRRHADVVSKLVLSHTYPPVRARASNVSPAMRLFKVLPMFLVKKMLRDRMIGMLPPKPSPELLLVAAQVRETVDTRLTRQAALNTFYRMMDFDNQNFSPTDLDGWPGQTLIMLASDDPTTPESLRKALLDLYPGARLHLFKGSGHATAILETREYIQVLESFLGEGAPAT
jgi:pimeloyl-ACP methyl ester carboxylesterase